MSVVLDKYSNPSRLYETIPDIGDTMLSDSFFLFSSNSSLFSAVSYQLLT
jgi:hypothetical protein